jgi:membrane protease YdiL (CAAX protease family)
MFQQPPIEHPVVLFVDLTSAVIWAPIVEETIFRGLLYGWIRQHLGYRSTILITSAIFGMIHPYSPLGMIQVACGGLLFGLLREWRGSLIAPMTAHAINNGLIAFISITIARAIGG